MINESERIKNQSFDSGKVFVDDNGVAGTTFPIGTPTHPVSNFANALTIAAARNIRHLHIHGTFGAITETLSGYWIEGIVGPLGAPFLTLAAGVANAGTTFNHCMVAGAANGWSIYENDCLLISLTGVQGLIRDCNLNGTIKLGSGITDFDCCSTVGGPITLDLDDITGAGSCIIHNFTGTLTLTNLDTPGTIKIYSSTGTNVTIAASCTAGTINIYGNCCVTNNTGGTAVNDYSIYTRTKGLDDIYDGLVAVDTVVDAIKIQTDKIAAKMLFSMDFWSNSQEEVLVTGAQLTPALPSVTIADLPGTATIVRAIAMFKFRIVENTNAAENSIDATAVLPIQVDDGAATGFVTAIYFVDEQFKVAATTREGGDVVIGDNDIATRVDANDTYPFQWLNAKAHLANLQFNDVQTGLRIWYSI